MNGKTIVALASLASAVLLAGCIQEKTVLNVEKDGSGTMEQTLYHKMPDLPMGAPMKQPTAEEQLQLARTQAEQAAKKMGGGVSVKTVEQLPDRDGWKGMRIVYAFADVSQIRVNPFPDMSAQMGSGGPMPGGPPAAAAPPPDEKQEWVRFEFTKGPAPKLTLLMPPMTPPEGAGPPAGQDDNPQAQAMAKMMMAQFLDGAKMEFLVKVDGKITDTDASYVSSSRQFVGIMQMDLGGLVKNSAALDKMSGVEKATTREEVEKQLKDPELGKYMKVETKEKVEITFQ